MHVIPALKRWKEKDPWNSLVGWLSLVDKSQTSGRLSQNIDMAIASER